MPATKKHFQHAPSTKTECDYLNGWIKKQAHTQKSHAKVVNPRDIAGERKKKKKKSTKKGEKKVTYSNTVDSIETDNFSGAVTYVIIPVLYSGSKC